VIQPIRAQTIRPNMTCRLRVAGRVHAGCIVALYCGRALAQEQQAPPMDEVAVSTERQNQLENESLTLSGTPDAGPHLTHTAAVLGLGPLIHPAYVGSNKNAVTLFPYVDIRGLLHDRVFFADVGGIGVKILNQGLVRAGVSVTFGGGRKSSDDPRLNGLPNVEEHARVNGYIALAFKPVILEVKVGRRTGAGAATNASFGATHNFVPLPKLHLSLSADIAWANAADQELNFGITPTAAAAARAQGNPLPAYTPQAGFTTATLVAAGVYQFSRHWGVIGRFSLSDLVGSSVRNSPLTQRTFALSSFAVGAAYSF